MRNLNAFIGALALASPLVAMVGIPYGGFIGTIGLGLLLPLFLFIQFILDTKDKNGSWVINSLISMGFLAMGWGSLFKIMHWPGSGFIITLSLGLFLPIGVISAVLKGFGSSTNKIARIFAGIGGISMGYFLLFKMMHWPGGSFIGLISIPFVAVGLYSLAVIWKNTEFNSSVKSSGFIIKAFIIPVVFSVTMISTRVSKSILDSFVAIEDNVQKSSIVQLDRGNSFKNDMKAGYASNNESNKAKAAKIKYYINKIDSIDKQTAQLIEFIDQIKLIILEKSGENIQAERMGDKETIIWKKYDKNDPLRPSRINSIAIQAKDQYDVPMYEIIGDDISNPDPSKVGMKLWYKLNDYRAFLVETLGSLHSNIDTVSGLGVGNPKFTVKTKPINSFGNYQELENAVTNMLNKTAGDNKSNHDFGVLKQLFIELTKQERTNEYYDIKNVHWIGVTFDHSPLVAALASLTTLQSEILNARATAVGYLSSKVSLRD
jgi:hypothetical protein